MEALYFSLSTMTTIGYAVSDYYFSGCWTPLLLVIAQSCTAITFDAIAVGILFQRISRGHKRRKSILFSDKAVIRRVRGIPHLMFRVAELRHHQLLEATVRVYCIRHERHLATRLPEADNEDVEPETLHIETAHFASFPMELLNDGAGSHILMSLPQTLTHRLDEKSPLSPTARVWYDKLGRAHRRDSDLPSTHDLDNFLRDRAAEIIILLEGTEALTGAAIQARHSYSVDDLEWNKAFAPCVFPSNGDDETNGDTQRDSLNSTWRSNAIPLHVCRVDFARFHDTVDAPLDCLSCPYVTPPAEGASR